MSPKGIKAAIELTGKVLNVARTPRLYARRGRAWSQAEYERFIKNREPKHLSPVQLHGPLISIVVPAFNTPDEYFLPMVNSVLAQTYSNWELIIVDASTRKDRQEAIALMCPKDKRASLIRQGKNLGIAGNTNSGIEAAKGSFVAFLDHDDTLAEFALNEVVAALARDKTIDVFYSDEDKLSNDGRVRTMPLFKPGWSPFLFYATNYLAHFVVVRRQLVGKIGGIRQGYDGAQDYDFLLRLLRFSPKFYHVPMISYHWRQAVGSTASDIQAKPEAGRAGERALSDYFRAAKVNARVSGAKNMPTTYHPEFSVDQSRVVVVGGSADFSKVRPDSIVVYKAKKLRPISEDWARELASVAAQSEVGAAGGEIMSGGRVAEQGYFVEGKRLVAVFNKLSLGKWTYLGLNSWPREFVVVSPHCFAVKASDLKTHQELLDPVRLFVRLFREGKRNVFWPYAVFRGRVKARSLPIHQKIADPYLNPNVEIKGGLPVPKP